MTYPPVQSSLAPGIAFNPILQRSNRALRPQNPKVLVFAARGRDSLTEAQHARLSNFAEVHYQSVLRPMSPAQFVEAARNFDFIALTRRAIQRLGRDTLSALPRLKGISVYSTGTEWIDTDFLRASGIPLASLPDYCTNAVAETALGLLLLSAHKLHLRYLKTTHAIPDYVSLRGRELYNGTVGIIGFGRIGRLLVQKVQPLCKRVLVYDSDPEQLNFVPIGVSVVGKKSLLSHADWVVCCASQNYEEKTIMTEGDYTLLRPETTLINVARTSLFDHARLVEMVQSQQLGAYFYDDFLQAEEKSDGTEFGKIVPMGHTAWYTDEAMEAGTESWIENLFSLINTCSTTQKTQISIC
jgi:phosphoglycerate dehydrogenase-like enzyme